MRFDQRSQGLVRIKKLNFIITKEIVIYRNNEIPVFGLGFFEDSWMIIHLPSETMILSCFPSPLEAERFLEILGERIDLNSIFLFDPRFKSIDEMIRYDVELAYKKYLKRRNEKNSDI